MSDDNDPPIPSAPVQQILAAARFAAEKHASQRRKGLAGEPYVNHVIEVAELIAASSDVVDTHLVMAGLLHDTIEDCGVTFQELEQQFGADVATLVAEVTDDKTLPKARRKALQVENAPKKSVRAQVIKLADKISNLRSILDSPPADWDLERRRQYFEWAHQVVSGLRQPNALLKAEFDEIYSRYEQRLQPRG
jgi:guanosine-3',5'-bis(diphosphate) 3'-pyrophosphohydrolase